MTAAMPCMVCREKNDDGALRRLEQLERLLRSSGIEPVQKNRLQIQWGKHNHCRYGLPCPHIEETERRMRAIQIRIEPYLAALAEPGREQLFHEVLELLRGYFPAAWHAVNRQHAKGGRI